MEETLELARLASFYEKCRTIIGAFLRYYHTTVFTFCQCSGGMTLANLANSGVSE